MFGKTVGAESGTWDSGRVDGEFGKIPGDVGKVKSCKGKVLGDKELTVGPWRKHSNASSRDWVASSGKALANDIGMFSGFCVLDRVDGPSPGKPSVLSHALRNQTGAWVGGRPSCVGHGQRQGLGQG